MKFAFKFLTICLLAVFVLSACGPKTPAEQGSGYVLTTALQDGKLVFVGVGRDIAGVINPTLKAAPGEQVTVTLINGEGAEHDIFFPEVGAKTERVNGQGKSMRVTFTTPTRDGAFVYLDSVPGHAEAGMQGYLLVGNAEVPATEAPVGATEMPAMNASNEATIAAFQKGACASCHTIAGIPNAAGVIGPDLSNVSQAADEALKSGTYTGSAKTASEFIQESIEKPDAFLAPTCPTGPCPAGLMPGNLTTTLSSDEISAIVQYLSSLPAGAYGAAASAASAAAAAPTTGADVARDPTDLPAPIGERAPTTVRIDLEAVEVVGQLADGTTFPYWTFNKQVPGPFFRVRVGDTIEVHLKNDASSTMNHSVDFHAVTGPGGGAVFTTTAPGQETMFTFKALIPGAFVYHCATPMVAEHIANGMYGMILVEPEGGLPKVDREFYVMQGEIYTSGSFGDQGMQMPDVTKLLNETPDYYVLNGNVGALTTEHPLKANVGETIRIFFGVGGPNKTSAFHVIGEMFDRVYNLASVTTPPMTEVQTTLVPPGGATIVEFTLQVPGRYILVDHALSRMQRGLAGYLIVEGLAAPDIFNGTPTAGSGH